MERLWELFGETLARISKKVIARRGPRSLKKVPSWSKGGPSWPMLALRWRLGAQLGGLGVDFGSIWRRFGSILAPGSDSKNSEKNLVFYEIFCYSGGFGGFVEASWALVLAMLAPRSHLGAYFGGMLRHVGAKMATKSAKMSQHRRKSALRST